MRVCRKGAARPEQHNARPRLLPTKPQGTALAIAAGAAAGAGTTMHGTGVSCLAACPPPAVLRWGGATFPRPRGRVWCAPLLLLLL